ncbi:Very long-chain fatty acid transport [Lecanosticta acicola]|uniref:Very long-chain fatty acid transport protein n=1 Tax=Lecanosticta acicola TaxID=111012 RepID=A0AAI8Z077_9PEZI|nr:Very long-chain fatty acid transport [Lecanosticta acicola]
MPPNVIPHPWGLIGWPLSKNLPAAAAAAGAGLAYLDAKYLVTSDLWAITQALRFQAYQTRLEKQDRVNSFYAFQELAESPKTAHNVFLVVPRDDQRPHARTQWTFAEAYDIVLRYARWLKEEQGVKKNEIIAMDIKNKPEFIWLWFALWSLGAMPAFLNSNLRDNAFIHCVKVSTTRLLILDPELSDALTDEARTQFAPDQKGRAVETVILEADVQARIEAMSPYRAPDQERSGAVSASPCMLIYTSGTTGLPKAANVPWTKPLSGVFFFPRMLQLKATDRYYTAMPLYHTSASILGVCQALGPACAIVLAPKFSPRTQMQLVAETKATVIQYIGEMCRYLVTSPPSPYDRAHNVRLAFGNGMRPDVWQKFKDRFNIPAICEFYGATEAPGASFVYSNNDFYRGAIGKTGLINRILFGGNQVLVRHDHETDLPYRNPKTSFCEKAPTDEPGELIYWLDPANISEKFQGYYGNDKASASKIIRDVFKKGDAYYRSGDLQKRDDDGRVWFVDRIGDTFRWKGENVSTAEVSEALGSHAALMEANVYGVQLPNHDGRAGCAAIGLTEGQSLDGNLGAELASHVKRRLPRYAVPLFLRISKELEVTGTMKHQKVALRNEGVDPSKVGDDVLFWMPQGSEKYVRFDKGDWEKISSGSAKL